jgi:hypothetical protein
MAATKSDIQGWFERGVSNNHTHLIVVCDTFDHDDYPVFVSSTEDVREVEDKMNKASMQRVMEVYNLHKPMRAQLDQHRAFNY